MRAVSIPSWTFRDGEQDAADRMLAGRGCAWSGQPTAWSRGSRTASTTS